MRNIPLLEWNKPRPAGNGCVCGAEQLHPAALNHYLADSE